MKTDSFFYRFFREFPEVFFALIGENERKARLYKFSSLEVKEQAFRFDGVFLPTTKAGHDYFFEAQFSRKPDFYSRFFGKIFLYLQHYHPFHDWRAVVIYPRPAMDTGVHRHYREFFESGRLRCFYLNQLPEDYLEKFPRR
jgi:predicted transposase/invertase (TIGR01784 family)